MVKLVLESGQKLLERGNSGPEVLTFVGAKEQLTIPGQLLIRDV